MENEREITIPSRKRDCPLKPPENCLVFTRHGEPDLPSPANIFLGHSGPGLSSLGKIQAEKVASWAKQFSWQGCFCSPLDRSMETAEIICKDLDVEPEVRKELAEIDLGDWDGQKRSDIPMKYPRLWEQREKDLYLFRYPGGESFADLEARAVPFVISLIEAGGRWLVVSHAGIFRVLLHSLFDIPFPGTFRFDPRYTGIRFLERNEISIIVSGFEKTGYFRMGSA